MKARILGLKMTILSTALWAAEAPREEKTGVVDSTMRTVLKPVAVATDVAVRTVEVATHHWDSRSLRMREVLDLRLPNQGHGKYDLTLDFEPKLGDLAKRDYVRYPVELRYGLDEHWECYGGVTPYSPNPFKGPNKSWGLGYYSQGVRYDTDIKGWFFQDLAWGVDVKVPLGNPPLRLIDRYTHVTPYLTLARDLPKWKSTKLLIQISYDAAAQWGSDPSPERVKRHRLEAGPALFYKPSEWGLFGQFAWRRFQEPERGEFNGSLTRGGGVWDIPMERSHKWGLKGKWQIEAALQVETEQGKDTDVGFNTRVRWKFDLKRDRKAP